MIVSPVESDFGFRRRRPGRRQWTLAAKLVEFPATSEQVLDDLRVEVRIPKLFERVLVNVPKSELRVQILTAETEGAIVTNGHAQ